MLFQKEGFSLNARDLLTFVVDMKRKRKVNELYCCYCHSVCVCVCVCVFHREKKFLSCWRCSGAKVIT